MKRQVKRQLPEPPNRRELRRAARAVDPRGKPGRISKSIAVVAALAAVVCAASLVARAHWQHPDTPPDEMT